MKFKQIGFSLILASMSLFIASCSDSDKGDSYKGGDYDSKETLTYTGDAAQTALGAEFSIDVVNGKATLLATNAVIGNPELKIENIELSEKNGVTTFKAKDSNTDRDIIFNGIIEDDKLTITGDLTFHSDVLGKWEMPFNQTFGESPVGIVEFTAKEKAELNEDEQELAESAIGMIDNIADREIGTAIGKEINQLSIDFLKNGSIGIKYRLVKDGTTHEALPIDIPLNYFIKEGKLFIAVPADLLKAIPEELKKNEVVAKALEQIKYSGKYATIEILVSEGMKYKKRLGNYSLFHLNPALFVAVVPTIINYINENIDSLQLPPVEFGGMILPDSIAKQFIKNTVNALVYLEDIKFGLGFQRVENAAK